MAERAVSGTTIIKCNCLHKYQDEKYGKECRIANRTASDGTRCTVCGNKK